MLQYLQYLLVFTTTRLEKLVPDHEPQAEIKMSNLVSRLTEILNIYLVPHVIPSAIKLLVQIFEFFTFKLIKVLILHYNYDVKSNIKYI